MTDQTTLIAHKTAVRMNNKQSSWMRQNCIARRLAYNYAVAFLQDATRSWYVDPEEIRKWWMYERFDLYPWMKPQRLVLSSLNLAIKMDFKAALNIWKKSGYRGDKAPTFQGRGRKLSVTMDYTAIKEHHINGRTITLPAKQGTVKLAEAPRFPGKVMKITFSYEGGKWYAALLIKTSSATNNRQTPFTGTAVGIDVGIAKHATLSNGEVVMRPDTLDAEREKLKRLQKRLSRMDGPIRGKRRASKNWLKMKVKLNRQAAHIANIRRNQAEHLSKRLAENYETVAYEDLKIKNMSGSAKGDAEKPGKNVAAKSGLNRELLNGGFYQLRVAIERKAVNPVAVNPAYTSQACNACGVVDRENRKSQSEFVCVACGHTENADINAARNILARAVA